MNIYKHWDREIIILKSKVEHFNNNWEAFHSNKEVKSERMGLKILSNHFLNQ